jgi:uncharacterized protein YaiL (DUF2058 family)
MKESLQDQLLALGLASKAKKKERPKTQPPKAARPAKKPRQKSVTDSNLSLDQAYRLRAKEEKQAAQTKKEQKLQLDMQRRQINSKMQELATAHALNDKAAEIKRNFLYKGRIRSVLVTPEQLKQLNSGELGLVFVRGNYYIMLPEHVELARAISPDHIPDLRPDEPDNPDEEGEYKVPDDLIW